MMVIIETYLLYVYFIEISANFVNAQKLQFGFSYEFIKLKIKVKENRCGNTQSKNYYSIYVCKVITNVLNVRFLYERICIDLVLRDISRTFTHILALKFIKL